MSQQHHGDRIIRQIEFLLYELRRQRAPETGAVRPRIRPIHTWDEQTKHLRFAEKVKLHRYPGGLANTTRWRRDQMVAAYRQRLTAMEEPIRADANAVHEALAYAIDAERFLGSLDQRDERDYFPIGAVDELAEHLLCWLEERGYRITAIGRE